MTEKREPIDLAAESADPAVRALVIRRRALGAEAAKLDEFFSVYDEANLPADKAAVRTVLAVDIPPVKHKPVVRSSAKKGSISGAFIAATRHVLLAARVPMPLASFYDEMRSAYPALAGNSKDYFRQKLYAHRDYVAPGQEGYWVVDEDRA